MAAFQRVCTGRYCLHTLPRAVIARPLSQSTTSSFFNQTSGRARRRRQLEHRLHQRKKPKQASANMAKNAIEEVDTRSVTDILFPRPNYGPEPEREPLQWPTSFSGWIQVLKEAWRLYRSTWDGFWTSRGFLVEDQATGSDLSREKLEEAAKLKSEELKNNVKRNVEFVKTEAEKLQTQVREQTGINNVEDMKRVAGDMLRLASDCVKEFMAGYRKGRDDEVQKMLTQYFQELENEVANKKKRRKRKRRIVNDV